MLDDAWRRFHDNYMSFISINTNMDLHLVTSKDDNVHNCVICANPVSFGIGIPLRDRIQHGRMPGQHEIDTVAQILNDLFEVDVISQVMDQFVCSECNSLLFHVQQLVPVWHVWKKLCGLRKRLNRNGYIGMLKDQHKWSNIFENSKETQTPELTPSKCGSNAMTEDGRGLHNVTAEISEGRRKESDHRLVQTTEELTEYILKWRRIQKAKEVKERALKRSRIQKAKKVKEHAPKRRRVEKATRKASQSEAQLAPQSEAQLVPRPNETRSCLSRATQTLIWNNVATQTDIVHIVKVPKAATKKKPFIKHPAKKVPQAVNLTANQVQKKRDEVNLIGWQHSYTKVRKRKRKNVACATDDLPIPEEVVPAVPQRVGRKNFKDEVTYRIQSGRYLAAIDHAMRHSLRARTQILTAFARRAGTEMKRYLELDSVRKSQVTREVVMDFNWQDTMKEFKTHLPILYAILTSCVARATDVTSLRLGSKRVGKSVPGMGLVISMIARMRTQNFKIIPTLIGMYLYTHGLSRNALNQCVRVGLCPSIHAVMNSVKKVLSDRHYPPNIMNMRSGTGKDCMHGGAAHH